MSVDPIPPRRRGLRFGARLRAGRRRLGRALRVARRFAVRTTLRAALYSVVAGASVAAGLAVTVLADEYGYHPIRNAAAWAAQPVQFAVGGTCAGCHGEQQSAIASLRHAPVACQACHGPLAAHAAAAAGVTVSGPVVTSDIDPTACLLCHEGVSGRPAAFPVVEAARHFGGAPCLLCHDPHETTALDPPPVMHPLDRLPDCLVCHGPQGLRPMPERHPVWSEGDCLTCHLQPKGGTS